MSWEKRVTQRIRIKKEDEVYLLIEKDKQKTKIGVLDISKGGIKAQVNKSLKFKIGDQFENCMIGSSKLQELSLKNLTVVECRKNKTNTGDTNTGDDNNQILRMQSDDDETHAHLWLAMERHRSGFSGVTKDKDSLKRQEMPKVPARGIYSEDARVKRLEFVREYSGRPLENLTETKLNARKLTGNIENLFCGVEIPVGLGGPLLINGHKAKGYFFAPFATTEGALVASASRGATALSRSGGVNARVISQRMMRVPLFVLKNVNGVFLFAKWIHDHTHELEQQVRKVSKHARLISVTPNIMGNSVHVSFVYETGDAAGQNMVTACTWKACQWLMQQMKHFDDIKFSMFAIDSNMSGDKKVNYQSYIAGRGIRVLAECYLNSKVLKEVLKVTPEDLVKGQHYAVSGSLEAGMVGFNMNIANVLAAIFTATGQDIASVHESSIGHFDMQLADDGVYASMLLPSLIIGTMGGGTHLPQQNELLDMMDCSGPGKVFKLAEIIASFCLALDLSTLSAGVSGQFAVAHERLGRNRPVEFWTQDELSTSFFTPGVKRATGDENAKVIKTEYLQDTQLGSSIITELSARKTSKLLGIFPYELTYNANGNEQKKQVIVKVKPTDDEVMLMGTRMAGMCNAILAQAYNQYKKKLPSVNCHVRELGICAQQDPRFKDYMPTTYETYTDESREAYILVIENLDDVELKDTADDTSGWTQKHIEAALKGAAQFHSVWYGREEELKKQPWLGPVMSASLMTEMSSLWESLGVHAAEEFPEWLSQENLALHRSLVNGIPEWWAFIENQPRTLVHNDFNPRNICFRKTQEGPKLCAYDWELATLHIPQHDLAELLCFVLTPDSNKDEVDHYVEFHRKELEKAINKPIEPKKWRIGYKCALFDFTVNRIALYLMAHTFRHYSFMERVVETTRDLMHIETKLDL